MAGLKLHYLRWSRNIDKTSGRVCILQMPQVAHFYQHKEKILTDLNPVDMNLCTIYIYFKNEFSLHDNIENERILRKTKERHYYRKQAQVYDLM